MKNRENEMELNSDESWNSEDERLFIEEQEKHDHGRGGEGEGPSGSGDEPASAVESVELAPNGGGV